MKSMLRENYDKTDSLNFLNCLLSSFTVKLRTGCGHQTSDDTSVNFLSSDRIFFPNSVGARPQFVLARFRDKVHYIEKQNKRKM